MQAFVQHSHFEYALSVARKKFPGIDFSSASMSSSSWVNDKVQIRGRGASLLCTYSSSEFEEYTARTFGQKVSGSAASSDYTSRPMARTGMGIQFRNAMQYPDSAMAAKSIVGFIRGVNLIISYGLAIFGFIASLVVLSQGDSKGLLLFPIFLVLSLGNYFSVRLLYIGLEMLADIAIDTRLIRMSQEKQLE